MFESTHLITLYFLLPIHVARACIYVIQIIYLDCKKLKRKVNKETLQKG